MGWMHDTLQYLHETPINRKWHHNEITFSMVYAYSEHYVLPISHDEVVYGKGSLFGKMPGDDWQRYAGVRAVRLPVGAPGQEPHLHGQRDRAVRRVES